MSYKSNNGNDFDVLIIGSGPGGYVAAIRAAQLGLSAACVEADKLGGVCLNVGCIPTKALLSSAFVVNEMKEGERHGIRTEGVTFRLGPAQERSRKVAEQMNRGIESLFSKNRVTHVQGFARLAGEGIVQVNRCGKESTFNAKHVILATGSRPKDLPFLKIDEDLVISSTGALMLENAPASLVVVGAGAVGIEFADVFNAYGTRVTIIEALDRILPLEDADCSAVVERSFRKRGVNVFTGARLEKAELHKEGVKLTFEDRTGNTHELDVERVLSAVGRIPNTEDIGLESVGVKTENGFVVVDEQLRTNVEGIYAIGDCAGRQLLAHKASHEGVLCIEHIAGNARGGLDYENVPSCTYCHPEVASVGLTEAQAKERGLDVQIGKFPWLGIGRAVAGGHAEGLIKVVRDKKYSEILGAHIVGPHATELIAEFVLGRHLEATVEELEKAMHPHPTLSEGVAEGALAALGRPIHI